MSLNSSRDNIQNAEQKVAQGIQKIYTKYKSKDDAYDAQGICTVFIEQPDIDIAQHFPNGCKKGITVHYFKKDFIKQPPLRYTLEQRIQSLYDAANTILVEKIQEKQKEKKKSTSKESTSNIVDILLSPNEEAIQKAIQEAITKAKEAALKSIQALLKNKESLEKFFGKFDLQKDLKEKSDEIMKIYLGEFKEKLDSVCKKYHVKFDEIIEKIFKEASHHRTNSSDSLTFNEEDNTFSFDEVYSDTTAHDRGIKQNTANLSIAYEGKIKNNDAAVTSSIVKHASLAPIDAIYSLRIRDPNESRVDILRSTCNHIEEVAKTMATFQRHGRNEKDDTPITIDWTYQLLTTNALDLDKQASTYGYIVKAAHLMNGVELDDNGKKITLNMHVMNAGINSSGERNVGYKKDTQRRENRKAYIHISKSIDRYITPENKQALKTAGFRLYFIEKPKELTDLETEYKNIESDMLENAKLFNTASDKATIKFLIEKSDVLNDQMRHITYKIEVEQKKEWEENRKILFEMIRARLGAKSKGVSDEEIRTRIVATRKISILQLIAQQQSSTSEIQKNIAKQLVAITVCTLKEYMDELYYSGEYRQPQNAAIFNVYLAEYQRLTGMMASTGCKSANDRTYVIRLLLGLMAGEIQNEKGEMIKIPTPYHLFDKEGYKQYLGSLGQSGQAYTNTALVSAINDSGSTPKVEEKSFSSIAGAGVDLGKSGEKFASHKITSDIFKKGTEAYRNAKAAKLELDNPECYSMLKNLSENLKQIIQCSYWNDKGEGIFGAKLPDGIQEMQKYLAQHQNDKDFTKVIDGLIKCVEKRPISGKNRHQDVSALYNILRELKQVITKVSVEELQKIKIGEDDVFYKKVVLGQDMAEFSLPEEQKTKLHEEIITTAMTILQSDEKIIDALNALQIFNKNITDEQTFKRCFPDKANRLVSELDPKNSYNATYANEKNDYLFARAAIFSATGDVLLSSLSNPNLTDQESKSINFYLSDRNIIEKKLINQVLEKQKQAQPVEASQTSQLKKS